MWYYDGWSWLWMAVTMILFWGGLIALVVFAVRALARPGSGPDSALETLRRRLAAGEISQDEYEKTKRALQA
jgi:putative membrane protein